jgi:hypothetical protein
VFPRDSLFEWLHRSRHCPLCRVDLRTLHVNTEGAGPQQGVQMISVGSESA